MSKGKQPNSIVEIVPSFRIRRKAGRKRDHDTGMTASLLWDFFKVKRQLEAHGKKAGPHAAASILLAWPRYKGFSRRALKSLIERRMPPDDMQTKEGLIAWMRRRPLAQDGKTPVMTNEDINLLCESMAYLVAEFIHSSKL